jgi:hypothetical protein
VQAKERGMEQLNPFGVFVALLILVSLFGLWPSRKVKDRGVRGHRVVIEDLDDHGRVVRREVR